LIHRRPGARRFTASLLDARAWLHLLRLVHYYNYSHVAPRRRARFGRGVAIAPNVSFRNGERIVVGHRARIGTRCFVWAGNSTGRIEIGDDTLLGPEVFLTASNYGTRRDKLIREQERDEGDVVIGRDVWLGTGVVVLPGVRIGDGCVVGAGAVVTRSLPDRAIAVGAPARVVGHR
jgi:acetyltransferase-like isoleucine patch superfamily enzyme